MPSSKTSHRTCSLKEADEYVLTAMTAGKKNPDRINLKFNNQFGFTLDLAQVVEFKLKVGDILTPADLEFYRKASGVGKLYTATLNWIFLRPRSIAETRDYLKRKQLTKPEYKIEDADINDVLERLTAKKYLDDKTFADWYVESRMQKRGISEKKLRLELQTKYHVDKIIIDHAIDSISRSDEDEIQKIITKKRRLKTYNIDNCTDEEAEEKNIKLTRYLVAQGFSYELSKQAVFGTDW